MNDQMFTVIQGRFDKLDYLLEKHIEKFDETKAIVDRHERYVKIIKRAGAPSVLASIAGFFGWKHLN